MLMDSASKIPYMATLGERIQQQRKARGFSQSELGRRVGISSAAVSQWENGQTKGLKPENLLAAAKALDVNIEWLISGHMPTESTANDSEYALDEEILEDIFSFLETYRKRLGDAPLDPDEWAHLTAMLYPEYKAGKEAQIRDLKKRSHARFEQEMEERHSKQGDPSTTTTERNAP